MIEKITVGHLFPLVLFAFIRVVRRVRCTTVRRHFPLLQMALVSFFFLIIV